MAIARVQTATGAILSGTSNPITVSATGAGNAGVIVSTENSAWITAISGGGTWVEGEHSLFANYAAPIWYCLNMTGGVTTVTVTYGSSTRGSARFIEYSGIKTSAAADVHGTNNSPPSPGNTSASTSSVTPSAGPFVAIAVMAHISTTTVSAGPTAGFSSLGTVGVDFPVCDSAELIGTSPSALNVGWTLNANSDWEASIFVLLGTTGTPSAAPAFTGGGFF